MKIFEYTHDQFATAFQQRYGRGTYFSTPVYRQVMKNGKPTFAQLAVFVRLPGLAAQLAEDLELSVGCLVNRVSDNGVVKFVTRLADGLEIESVVIPMFRRHTLCVSSQVGCRMGCRFCRTGEIGLVRNLTPGEIVGQVFTARHQLGFNIRNVVFMGMGEPLDNIDNVIQAIRVLTDQRGLDIARRHITVSTVGLTAGIDRLATSDDGPVNLAVSLNAPDDAIRSRLMPINRTIPMAALKKTLLRYPLTKKSALFVSYVLIQGINDRQEHARALARYLAPMKAKLNLIPFNAPPSHPLASPTTEMVERFQAWLVAEKIFVRRRGEKGSRILAACGQLGGKPSGVSVSGNQGTSNILLYPPLFHYHQG